ncbi:hypothetical protein [Ponticaulis koreensis]|uniref:hypothetical protein n=1 Tax=Ponticaulis koreensis TaxID=1123045 RepID=UPI0003B40986|nr:hypothetical protein [Ponticaulis koreensis]
MNRLEISLTVCSIVTTLISIGMTLYAFHLRRKLQKLDLGSLRYSAQKLAQKIVRSGYQPDVLLVPDAKVAITAYLLSEYLPVPPAIVVGCRQNREIAFNGSDHPKREGYMTVDRGDKFLFIPDFLRNYSGRKFLFVDSIHKRGTTMNVIRTALSPVSDDPSTYKTCCFVRSKSYDANNEPDFFHREMSGRVVFPWGTVDVDA